MYDITILDSVDSTNEYAKVLAKSGTDEKKVIIAKHQTKGKGRNGRSFFSPEDNGLYMSVILRPHVNPSKAVYITALAALAVSEATDALTGLDSKIKWVNDIFINGKKICGILTEGALGGADSFSYVILGIGVNIARQVFPEELNIATSILNETEVNTEGNLSLILANEILDRFFVMYDELNKIFENGKAAESISENILHSFVTEYKRRSFLIGEQVNVYKLTEERGEEHDFCGTAVDIDDDFKLLIRKDNGETVAVDSGEVRVRPV